jgi:uncharacterized metal-binding protein
MLWISKERKKTNNLEKRQRMSDMPVKPMIFTCAGASNCGQMANAVAVKFATDGLAVMSCLAGVGSHTQKYIDGAINSSGVIAVDGCAVACAKKTLEHAGITVKKWCCITDFGIKKTSNKFDIKPGELDYVLNEVRQALSSK